MRSRPLARRASVGRLAAIIVGFSLGSSVLVTTAFGRAGRPEASDAARSTAQVLPIAIGSSWHALMPPRVPPHLVPGIFDPSTDLGSNLSLAETIESLGPWRRRGEAGGAEPAPVAPSDPGVIAEVARHYVQARAALLANQLLLAATHFEAALAKDPASPDLLVGYAALLARLGNTAKSRDFYERALAIDPTQLEAMLAVGFQARQRGGFDDAIRLLGPLVPLASATEVDDARGNRPTRASRLDAYPPQVRLAIAMALAEALAATGADAALIEVVRFVESDGPQELDPAAAWHLHRLRRVAGDAHARRGAVRDAWQLWSQALRATIATDDPDDPRHRQDPSILPLAARVLWAERSLLDGSDADRAGVGDPVATLSELMARMAGPGGADDAPRDAWISLAEWLASTATDESPLDAALRAKASSLPVRRGEPRFARLAAALAPAQAFERLAASHDRRAPDRQHIAAWLRAAASISSERAVSLATTLLADTPLAPEFVVDGLLHAGLSASALLDALAGETATASRVALRMRVLSRYERTAEAWSLGEAALARANEPADRDILLRAALAVTVAAGRFEAIASLVERLRSEEHASGVGDASDPARRHINLANEIEILRSWTEAVQATAAAGADRALGPTLDPAVIDASADRVEALAGDDLRASTIVRLARAKRAAALPITDRERASQVLGLFRSAIECATPAPHLVEAELEEAWIAALSLTRSLFPRAREDRLSDEEIAAEDAILASLPESAIAVGVRAARESRSDRRGDLVEAICAASAARPMEVGLLREAVRGLATARSVGEAIALLDERLDRSPAVPEVWQLWTERAIEAGLAEVALERLNRHAATEEPDADPIGAILRVLPLRALGRESEAAAAEERALERRLPTQRTQMLRVVRAIDRAAAGGTHGEAVELLWTLAEELRPSGDEGGGTADDGLIRGRIAALDLALRLPSGEDPGGTTDPSDRARLIRRFAEDILTSADRPGVIETIGPAPMIRAAGMLALVVDDLGGDAGGAEDASTQRAAIASRAVALQARTRAELDAPGALPWLTIAQAFADAGRHAAGSDFLAALATSEVRMRPNAAARIATACFALDAAAGGRAERSIALLDLSRARGVRPFAGPERVVDRDADEIYLLAGLYAMVHDQAGARAILDEALRRDPQHAMSMNNLGWDRLEAGEQGDAVITLIEGAYAGRPDDAAILDSIGWLRYKQGRIDEAVELLTRAIAITEGETSLEILDHFGDAAWRHGQRDAARNAWREVVRQAESTYAKEVIVGRLPDYERREHGVVVIDAAALWQRVYGTPRDRARAKLDAIEAGGDPTVADIW